METQGRMARWFFLCLADIAKLAVINSYLEQLVLKKAAWWP
jgi:hypothetical protein